MSMQSIKNRHAKIKDLDKVYRASVMEANLASSAMVTILGNVLIDKGIMVKAEVEALLSDEKITAQKEQLRQYLIERQQQGVG